MIAVFRILIFSLCIFVSAGLLFSIQPVVSKMILPMLGGAPSVWNTVIVFFQGALFTGYVYAFFSARYLTLRRQTLLHAAVLLIGLYFLPVAISESTAGPSLEFPQLWLLSALLASVAFPFIGLSGSSTLLQNWFAHSGDKRASDPYFLYAASNSGSLIALISYPTVIEPMLGLDGQSRAWSMTYIGLIGLIVICGGTVWKQVGQTGRTHANESASVAPVTVQLSWSTRFNWLFLSFVPSMMLLGVTLHISVDVASVPFLWVLPLIVYLLTFIVAFADRQFLSKSLILESHAAVLILLALFYGPKDYWVALSLPVATLLFSGFLCHGSLASLRPAPSRLSEFYLWIALGGWLGGIAGGLLAPILFEAVLEYQIALVLVCLARYFAVPAKNWGLRGSWVSLGIIGFFFTFSPKTGLDVTSLVSENLVEIVFLSVLFGGLYAIRNKVLPFALAVSCIVVTNQSFDTGGQTVILQDRTFFGVYRVLFDEKNDVNSLWHGTTIHGAQALHPYLKTTPLLYYWDEGPLGQVISAMRETRTLDHIGVVGLGVGSIACLLEKDERITFFEIDPAVAKIATDRSIFSFLSECGNHPQITIGDGRLKIVEETDEEFDILIIDAFSSDAIPVHLLTQEAVEIYLQKLRPGGVLVFHITNRHLRLAPVLARLTRVNGLAGVLQEFRPLPEEQQAGAITATWVTIARSESDLDFLFLDAGGKWLPIEMDGAGDLWTDDFSNLLGVLNWTSPTNN